ncbi:MAG: SpoIVB peptidase [Peptococcaceae bacterium]|nr:SpoIVB peptidase [Peptococcaceae bacterium]
MIKKQWKKIFLIGFLFVFAFSIQQSAFSINSIKNIFIANSLQSQGQPVYNFLGLFPKNKEVSKPNIDLIPGGQSIGVTLQTKGVLVVGYSPIIDEQGKEVYPAKDSGVQIGDIILKINGNQALSDFQVAQEIDKNCKKNQKVILEIKHKGKITQKTIQPVYCAETARYRIGLYIRDEAAGVGTLTFIDPQTGIFGALGHVVSDSDTNEQIELSKGKIVESSIYAIEKGKRGDPGEKIGTFVTESSFSGKIEQNNTCGIFGKYKGKISNPYFKTPIPVGWETEVSIGPAKFYTVIQDNTIEEFDLTIEKILPYRNDNKNMIVKITDSKLLEKSGGIIQGMSGSPIIQNGKIVGAITHVFVNDSTRGYAVFIGKMLEQSGILSKAATAQRGGFFNVFKF